MVATVALIREGWEYLKPEIKWLKIINAEFISNSKRFPLAPQEKAMRRSLFPSKDIFPVLQGK